VNANSIKAALNEFPAPVSGAVVRAAFFLSLSLVLALALPVKAEGTGATVIVLTQTGCQFLEPEPEDHEFKPQKPSDCVALNAKSGKGRMAAARTMVVKPGRYVFRVVNRDVPYEVGFYLRAASEVLEPFKPKASGGGIMTGRSRDYPVDLEEGDYLFSCPLNPTPVYRLRVEH
jgi:hypothetical protein